MILKFWAGYITPEIIGQHVKLDAWALTWLNRARKAESEGKELVVFEIPKNELIYGVGSADETLQKNFPASPVDPMLFDLSFMKALFPGDGT